MQEKYHIEKPMGDEPVDVFEEYRDDDMMSDFELELPSDYNSQVKSNAVKSQNREGSSYQDHIREG